MLPNDDHIIKALSEGFYRVESNGDIIRVATGKTLKQSLGVDGYARVSLSMNGKHKCAKAHRVVAIALVPNPRDLHRVNHIDGCKTNNAPCNLEWVTDSENLLHAHRIGLKRGQFGSTNGSAKITEAHARQVKDLLSTGLKCAEVSRRTGVHPRTVSEIKRGRQWSHA